MMFIAQLIALIESMLVHALDCRTFIRKGAKIQYLHRQPFFKSLEAQLVQRTEESSWPPPAGCLLPSTPV